MSFLKEFYGDVESSLGIPMQEEDAKHLDELLDSLDEVSFDRHIIKAAAPDVKLTPGERADISWISTESLDRRKDVVLSSGMDASHFRKNPIVTLDHNYWQPPIGKSLWQRKFLEGDTRGIKAKTVYPSRPEGWDEKKTWEPDSAFALVQAGLMVGKSIGFLTLESHPPTEEEVRKRPEWAGVRRIITKWLLLEYACTWLPANQDTITTAVSKGLCQEKDFHSLNIALPTLGEKKQESEKLIPFTSMEEIDSYIKRHLNPGSLDGVVRSSIQESLGKLTGKV